MPIYLVTPLNRNTAELGAAVQALPNPDFFPLQSEAGFLVKFAGTSVELSHALGVTSAERAPSVTGPAMITSVGTYYGLGATPMWEWLKTRFEQGA